MNRMKDSNDLTELTELIKAGVSPFHTIGYSADLLKKQGFKELSLTSPWQLEEGMGYFVNIFDTTLAGFTIGRADTDQNRPPKLRICASHTDWPCLMVKPRPEQTNGHYGKLNISVYGAPILNTWLDRPLSIAGKVCLKGASPFHPEVHIVDFKRPLLTIPNLPIHFNREVNRGIELNPQIDMQPLMAVLDETLNQKTFFVDLLAEELQTTRDQILDYECCIYNCDEPQLLGVREEMLSSPRLDNLTSVQACLNALINSRSGSRQGIRMALFYHNEEIGSKTKQGAASLLAERMIEKLYLSLGYSRSDVLDVLLSGFLLSLDVAHAFHPNKAEKYDPINRIELNEGVCLKLAASQAYATDASYVSVIEDLCQRNQIPYKKFTTRSDIRGGSTLGSISSSMLNMPAVDAGVPVLAMHSSRELMGAHDQRALAELARVFMIQE